jgi:DNA helicase II / ATP-dependent DNA helicase PcrA
MIITNEILSKLNSFQKDAVLDDSPALLLNAHVGSGKTTVLISKILYLSLVKGVNLNDMVVLTFTNKAANEIKARLKVSNDQVNDNDMPYFGTFHSVASKLLSQSLPIQDIGYDRDFSIMDTDELVEMANRLIIEKGFNIKFMNKLPNRIEAIKIGKKTYGNMRCEDDIEKLWECVVDEKLKQNKMDFDDLILNSTKLLQKRTFNPKWIIIDEFQDCDNSQLQFIKALCSSGSKIFAVGDPNQIIYSWRGSDKNIFKIFKSEYEANEMSLPINYRSSSTILDAAKLFLSDSSDLEGVRDSGNKVVVKNHYNPFNEAQNLCDQIKKLNSSGALYKDIAIFYRLQNQSKTIEEALVRENIPIEVSVKKSLKDIPVLQWFVKLLKASINKNDTNNIIATLSNKHFGEDLTLSQIKNLLNNKTENTSVLLDKIHGFKAFCSKSRIENIPEMYDYFELDNYLSPTSSNYLENRMFIVDFIGNIGSYIENKNLELPRGISEFLNSSSLYGINVLKEYIHFEEDSVKLMTLHSCKGLEFNNVFIVGANYGLVPLRTKTTDESEEEKRLFFVGITRAKDNLEISYYTSPDNSRVIEGPSNFVSMLPSHLIEKEDNTVQEVDLQSIRKQIIESKNNDLNNFQSTDVPPIDKSEQGNKSNQIKRVKHDKYGEGIVESEDTESITVLFNDYGSKTFSKVFTTLEYL